MSKRLFSESEEEKRKPKYWGLSKGTWCLIAALIVATFIGLAVMERLNDDRMEQERERADLETMRAASMVAADWLKKGLITQKTEYCYVIRELVLVPVGARVLEPYGEGTTKKAGGVAAFRKLYDFDFQYDEGKNYRGKVVFVTVDPAAPEKEQIKLAWRSPVKK